MQAYSSPERAADPHALPDIEVFELTAEEVVPMYEDEVCDYMACFEFRMASISSRVREKMYATMIEELSIKGGWFYQCCFPGCLPDLNPIGPFATRAEAIAAAQEEASC